MESMVTAAVRRWVRASAVVAALAAVGGVACAAETLYLKCNVHTLFNKGVYQASYANYTNPGTGHVIIPLNTEVEIKSGRRGSFLLVTKPDGVQVQFDFDAKRMNMDQEQYLGLITAKEPVSPDNFTDLDKQGIKDGKALVGMTKAGVMAALGYPATHRTPSPDAPVWVYWTTRMRTLSVEFDEAGKVKTVK